MKFHKAAERFTDNFGMAMDMIADAWHEVMPRGTTTIETLSDGETKNLRDFLWTHDLISIPRGGLVTAFIDDDAAQVDLCNP
jgi:hypothetical protein